ncbi:MAG: hypothetical protein M5R40_07255 [Anaerolineae bacterium]|nr:hypothetical protein [Anaerolineae bacterium]
MSVHGKSTTIARTDWKRACIYCGAPIRAGQEITKSVVRPAHVGCLVAEVEREMVAQREGRKETPQRAQTFTQRPREARRLEVLSAIAGFSEQRGYPPSIADLATLLDCSKTAVRHWLVALRARGDVAYEPRQSRTLRLTAQGRRALEAALAKAPSILDLVTGLDVLTEPDAGEIAIWMPTAEMAE